MQKVSQGWSWPYTRTPMNVSTFDFFFLNDSFQVEKNEEAGQQEGMNAEKYSLLSPS